MYYIYNIHIYICKYIVYRYCTFAPTPASVGSTAQTEVVKQGAPVLTVEGGLWDPTLNLCSPLLPP